MRLCSGPARIVRSRRSKFPRQISRFTFSFTFFVARFLARYSPLASNNIQTQDSVSLQTSYRADALTCIACHF